jgi:hypothetical protein
MITTVVQTRNSCCAGVCYSRARWPISLLRGVARICGSASRPKALGIVQPRCVKLEVHAGSIPARWPRFGKGARVRVPTQAQA